MDVDSKKMAAGRRLFTDQIFSKKRSDLYIR